MGWIDVVQFNRSLALNKAQGKQTNKKLIYFNSEGLLPVIRIYILDYSKLKYLCRNIMQR